MESWLKEGLGELRNQGLIRTQRTVESVQGASVRLAGEETLCFCSNNYLGLADDPELVNAMSTAVQTFGCSSSASPLISGRMSPHQDAEAALSAWLNVERTLLFSSGYAANVSVISSLMNEGDLIVSDALNHASIIDGCRLSKASVHIFDNGNVAQVEKLLLAHRATAGRCLIATDAIFSMDGHGAPLKELRALADQYDAWLLVDEAHALGVVGPEGRGWCAEQDVVPEILIGTLGKSLGLGGAFVGGSHQLVEWVRHRGRGYVFSTSVVPAIAAAVPTAVRLVREADDRRTQLREHTQTIAAANRSNPATALAGGIVPCLIGDPLQTVRVADRLLEQGFWVAAVRPPTVPRGTSRIRVVPLATHRPEDVKRLAAAIEDELN